MLMVETGHFATLWQNMANKLGLAPEFMKGDWRHGADPAAIEARLADDKKHEIRAVCVVHNETSTGVVSRIGEVRKAIDRTKHPALFMVDTIFGADHNQFKTALPVFQLPTFCAPSRKPISISVSRDRPRQMTVLPGGASPARAR